MYQLISAQGIAVDFDGQYYPIEIGNKTLVDIFNTYTNVIATLVRLSDNQEVALNLYDLPVGVRLLNITFTQFLINNGNKALPTTSVPQIEYKYAKFVDLWSWNFDVKLANRHMHPDYELTEEQKTDVLLSKVGADYQGMVNNYLFTVNGFVHRADHLAEGVVLFDANISKLVANNTLLGGIDFSELGGLEFLDITSDMLYRRNEGQPYSQALYLRLPRPIGNTIPLLVLGGYLHALDGVYSMVSDSVMRIDFSKYPWIKRYFTLRHQIDLESLGIEPEMNGTYSIDKMVGDNVIEALMDLSQTFIVLVKTQELRRGIVSLHYNGLPGVYETSIKPFAPIIIDDGRTAEYAVSTEHGKYSLRLEHYLSDRRVLETTHYLAYAVTAPLNVSERPTSIADAFFLMLSKTIGD